MGLTTQVQSQQMAFTRSPSLSNNPKILTNHQTCVEHVVFNDFDEDSDDSGYDEDEGDPTRT